MERADIIQIKDTMCINGVDRFVYSIVISGKKLFAKCAGLSDKKGVAGNVETVEISNL